MDIIFQSISDLLNQEYGRHGILGWFYLLSFIASIYVGHYAKEKVKKYQELKESRTKKLNFQHLTASLFTTEDNLQVKFIATLKLDGIESFHLLIEKNKNGQATTVTDVKKNSLDEIESYLRSKIKFILADFK
jgi:hypothetical protein